MVTIRQIVTNELLYAIDEINERIGRERDPSEAGVRASERRRAADLIRDFELMAPCEGGFRSKWFSSDDLIELADRIERGDR